MNTLGEFVSSNKQNVLIIRLKFQLMDEYFEELKQGAEQDADGLTNDVFFTGKGTVVKTYSKYPLTSFLESITSILNGRINYVSRDERMKNEVEMKKLIEILGFNTSEVIRAGEKSIEFEEIPGINGFKFLTEASKIEAIHLGREIGDFLPKLHGQGAAMNDFRLSNIHVDEELELYYIDHEYAKFDANSLMQKMDQLTLFSSARQTGNFQYFLEGFRQSDSDLEYLLLMLSIFVFGYHAILLERSMRKFVNGLKSLRAW